MEFEAKCGDCPVNYRLEKRAGSIIDDYHDAQPEEEPTARKEAIGRISTMTQEGRQIGCPLDKVIQLRREALREIDPDLEETDKRFRTQSSPQPADAASRYIHDRNAEHYQGESYQQWDYRRTRKIRT